MSERLHCTSFPASCCRRASRDAAPSALDPRPRPRRRRAAARDRALVRALAGARHEEAADAPRPARRQRLLRVLDPHLVVVRARRQAALGRHDLDEGERLLGREGRVAQGHGAHALGLRPGRDRDPPSADRRAAARRVGHGGPRRERRRRQAPAPDPGAARPLRDPGLARPARGRPRRDRRRRAPLARRALADPGARARRRERPARRPAAAAARASSARSRTTSTRSATPTSSTSCGCSASGWRRARTTCPRCASTARAGASRPSGSARARR